MSFISCGSARFNWQSCTVASLKVPVMIVCDMVMNVHDTKWFPQHSIADLISGITVIVLFQSGEASTVEGNKHTYASSHISTNNFGRCLIKAKTVNLKLLDDYSGPVLALRRGSPCQVAADMLVCCFVRCHSMWCLVGLWILIYQK